MKSLKLNFIEFQTVVILLASLVVARAANYTVQVNSFVFTPSTLTIGQGDAVTWTNISTAVNHTSTSGNTNTCVTNTFWNSSALPLNGTYTFTFTSFAAGNYPYFCSAHCSLFNMKALLIITNAAAATPPAILLTNPAAGAKFLAPANIPLLAAVTNGSGTVTNVQFFSGASPLGNVTAAPYNFTASNTAAGNYTFTARAFDNLGASATSAPVNVFVLTNAILTSPTRLADGTFQFTINGIGGQTYATEATTNFQNWTPIITNLAPANIFNVTDSTSTNILLRFYRARQDL